jgi:hypothetical protein
MTRKAVRLTAAVLAAVFLWVLATLPPRPAVAIGTIAEAVVASTVAGAFHVHSTRSDGVGDRNAIADAAARAGLRFVILTDHGDATRRPDPPAYIDGVLCIDAVEISTNGGHLIALDTPPAPYPLGGEPSAVVEDVLRLGGFPIVGHPDSAKGSLAWHDWGLPIGGLEWLNMDSEWRDESRARLARAAVDSLLRPAPALLSLLDRPAPTLARWDALGAAGQTVVGLAGHDAHGGLARGPEEGSQWYVPGLSSYESSFRTFSVRVLLDEGWTGTAEADARRLVGAIRRGRAFTALDAIAAPGWVDYRARSGGTEQGMGDVGPFESNSELTFRSTMAPGAVAVLLRDGAEVAQSGTGELKFTPTRPGSYRVEVRSAGVQVPWIVTNPIYFRSLADPPPPSPSRAAAPAGTTVFTFAEQGRVEKDPMSVADLVSEGSRRRLVFRLRDGVRASQYAAIALPLSQPVPGFDRVAFSARSESPMRVSVQLRFDSVGGARWAHSVYLSPESRPVVVPLDRLVAADGIAQPPPFESVSSLLFVVDLTNAAPGAGGWFEISDLTLGRLAR